MIKDGDYDVPLPEIDMVSEACLVASLCSLPAGRRT